VRKTFITIAAATGLASSGAWAEKSKCANQYELYGMLMRGALLCNTPERPAISKTIAATARYCHNLTDAMETSFIAKGFADFDRVAKKQGLRQACTGIDRFMTGIEGGAIIERRQE
jgi:hypothetical protein